MITTFIYLGARGYLSPYANQYNLPSHPVLVNVDGGGTVYQNRGEPYDYLMGARILTGPAEDDPDPGAAAISVPHTLLFDWSEPSGPAD